MSRMSKQQILWDRILWSNCQVLPRQLLYGFVTCFQRDWCCCCCSDLRWLRFLLLCGVLSLPALLSLLSAGSMHPTDVVAICVVNFDGINKWRGTRGTNPENPLHDM